MYRLVFTGRFAERPAWEAGKPLVFLGRGPQCDLRLAEDGVSDKHAAIERRDDGYYIRDLSSATGVRVNDNPVTAARLATHDEVEIGVVRFQFEVLHPPSSQARPLDLMQISVGIVITLLLVGQIALLSSIFASPRSHKMRTDTVRLPDSAIASASSKAVTADSGVVAEDVFIPKPATGTMSVPAVLNRQLRIIRTDRVDGTNNVVVRIQVRSGVGERELNVAMAAVGVQFFRVAGGDSVVGTELLWLPMPSRWENFTTQKFGAVFNGLPSQCAGFVVKTYYRNQLQDLRADPASLAANMGK